MIDLGLVKPGSTLYIPFASYAGSTGASSAMTGLATTDIEIYKNGSVTERASETGYTLLDTDGLDFDGKTGINGISIDLSSNADAGFFAAGARYWVVIADVTVDAQTVRFIAATFTIGLPGAVLNTTIATLASQTSFTLTDGPAENDALNGCVLYIHDVANAVQGGFAYVSDYTGASKTVTLLAGTTFTAAASDNVCVMPPTNVHAWAGTVNPTEHTAGYPVVTIKDGTGTGEINTNAGAVALVDLVTTTTTATNVTTVNGLAANVITATSIAADAITAAKIADNAIDAGALAADCITAAKIATGAIDADAIAADAITAAKIADGAIDAATFAAGAITATVIATGAVDADALAADAVAEIADGVWDEALAGHAGAGSAGEALSAAGTAGDPWTTALPGAYGAGTAGKIVGDNLNATVSSRATQTSVDTIDDFLDTEVAAIKAKTDQLAFTAGNVDSNVKALNGFTDQAARVSLAATSIVTAIVGEDSTATVINVGTISPEPSVADQFKDRWLIFGADTAITADLRCQGRRILSNTTGATPTITLEEAFTIEPEQFDTFTIQGLSPDATVDTGAVADAVWDEAIAGHLSAGSTGLALNSAGAAGDPWSTALPGAYGAGTAGKIVGDNVNATISSRASQASVDTVDTVVDAILVDTGTTLDGKIDVIDGIVDSILVDTGTTLDGKIDTIDTVVDAILVDTGTTLDARIPAALTAGGNMKSDVLAIDGSATAAGQLQQSAENILSCVADELCTTTTIILKAITPTMSVNDQLVGRIVIFSRDTGSVALQGQATDITNFDVATLTLTVTALTDAPDEDDVFTIQ